MRSLIVANRKQVSPTELFGLHNEISNGYRNAHAASVEALHGPGSDSGEMNMRVDPGKTLDNAMPARPQVIDRNVWLVFDKHRRGT